MDTLIGIQQAADGAVMIQRIDDICDVFAHIAVDIVRFGKKFRCLVGQIRCYHAVDNAIFHCLVELVQTVGKQTKGRDNEDAVGLALLQFCCHINHTLAGRNHIIYDNDILTLH